jgi:hypothetical protein
VTPYSQYPVIPREICRELHTVSLGRQNLCELGHSSVITEYILAVTDKNFIDLRGNRGMEISE